MVSVPDVHTVSLVGSDVRALAAWSLPELIAAVGSVLATFLLVLLTLRMNQWTRRQRSPIPAFLSGVIELKKGKPDLARLRIEFVNAGEAPIWVMAATVVIGIGGRAEGHPFMPVTVNDSGRGDATIRNVLAPGATVYVRLEVEVASEVADSWSGDEERSVPLLLHFTSGGKARVERYELAASPIDPDGIGVLRLASARGPLAWWSQKRAERMLGSYIRKGNGKPDTAGKLRSR